MEDPMPIPIPIPQSPSVEDLLAARSRCFREAGFNSQHHHHHNNNNHHCSSVATNSIYSTITSLSLQTDLDVSDAARLAMAEESANPVWSPSMSSNYEHGYGEDEENISSSSVGVVGGGGISDTERKSTGNNDDTETDGENDSESDVDGHFEQTRGKISNTATYLPTPTMSESEYSISPSLGSIRMASLVQKAPARASGLGISTLTTTSATTATEIHSASFSSSSNTTTSTSPAATTDLVVDHESNMISKYASTPTASPASRRVLNARNLVINTNGVAAERPYPLQSTTPPIPMPRSAELQASFKNNDNNRISPSHHVPSPHPPMLTSRSMSDSSTTAVIRSGNCSSSSSSSFRTAGIPSAPHTAVPSIKSSSSDSTSPSKQVKRSSTESSLSYLSSPTADEDDEIGPNKASLLRMQSFLGPKMKHISPAPWSLDGNEISNLPSTSTSDTMSTSNSISSLVHSDTISDIWAEIDSEVGSVRMATKAPRNNNNNTKAAATGTLKGLGMAIASTVAASVPSRPSLSNDRPASKTRTVTASSALSHFSSTARGIMPEGLRGGGLLIRSRSQEPFDATSLSAPSAVAQTSASTTMKVTNIIRSKSPDSLPPLPSSAPGKSSLTLAQQQQGSPVSPTGQKFPQLTTITSAPEASLGNGKEDGSASLDSNLASMSTSLPETAHATEQAGRRLPPLPRKRPPMLHQDSSMSSSTNMTAESCIHTVMTTATSMSSLPATVSDPTDLAARASNPNGMKLVSLEDARARERERVQRALADRAHATPLPSPMSIHPSPINRTFAHIPQAPIHAPPPAPIPATTPAKTLKTKKSGFLKLFNKSKEDHSAAPAVPRSSTDVHQSPRFAVALGRSNGKNVSPPRDLRKTGNETEKNKTVLESNNLVDESDMKTPVRAEFASALPFPHQQNGSLALNGSKRHQQNQQNGYAEPPRKSNSSAPPQVSLIKPSPDLNQHAFAGQQGVHLSPDQSKGDTLAPSLSLRPVSMMITSMPPAFLAELQNSGNASQQHLQAVQTPGSSGLTGFNAGGRSSPALTPDTPSFVFFDSDSQPSPQSGHTPSTPASAQFDDSPPSKTNHAKAVFGLPTPPHSASSSRTFSATTLPPPPMSPSTSLETSREAAITAPYRARIAELEKLLLNVRADLAHARAAPASPDLAPADGHADKKSCQACGCDCTGKASSILARPRVVGHGNMFSSGRD